MEEYYLGDKKKKLLKKIRKSYKFSKLVSILIKEDEEYDEYDDTLYEYIDLVYPPNSTPPNRNAIKKANLLKFNKTHRPIS